MITDKLISIVVPVFNEENNIQPFLDRLLPTLDKITTKYEIIFCLDPCTDDTQSVIENNIKKIIILNYL